MTNPNDIVRVRARNGGRASVYEANAWAQGFSAGLLEGNGVTQNTSADMNVLVGGSSTKPDVLIATNPAGYKIALDIVGQQAIAITAPASDSRISSIVAYTDDLALASEDEDVTGSPSSCGLIVVNGDTAASPTAPDDTAIRAAITEDGATGSQASYVVIANITVASTTTTITNSLISIKSAAIGSDKVDWKTIVYETAAKTITIAAGETKTVLLRDILEPNEFPIYKKRLISCLLVPTGPGTGSYLDYHFQGLGGSIDQVNYGLSITNTGPAQYTWTYKLIILGCPL